MQRPRIIIVVRGGEVVQIEDGNAETIVLDFDDLRADYGMTLAECRELLERVKIGADLCDRCGKWPGLCTCFGPAEFGRPIAHRNCTREDLLEAL